MSPNDLQVFLVLNEGGFRAAAKRLGIAPSKVSSTVSRIEKQLGVPLLLRTTRSVRATDQGHTLAERIQPLMTEMDAACFEAANSADHIQGYLRLNVPARDPLELTDHCAIRYRLSDGMLIPGRCGVGTKRQT
ncbi:LysR family transcriptional regulator [Sinorhizobium meliloti]|uniref:LysR family transcriptional regulator n=1 Tax=Rhizobium meliloti TaxID=382 RepID=UPI001911AA78|nr:LysR family transcriptional regulator [Sinorhizobium meliloti]